MLCPWLFLLAAVAVEVAGATLMKLVSAFGSIATLMFMYAMVGLSFYLLALAIKHLHIALAYATWRRWA